MFGFHRKRQVVTILGMHRSGTSFLTGSLQATGLYLGEHHTWNPYNKKGNRENPEFTALNDEILAYNEGDWSNPPEEVIWSRNHITKACKLIDAFSGHRIWGFKDPRTLLTFKGWHDLLPKVRPIGIFRHPLSVARSLKNRSDMPLKQGFDLWYCYNHLLLDYQKQINFPLLRFEADTEILHDYINQFTKSIGLGEINEMNQFYTDELNHHRINQRNTSAVPTICIELYDRLVATSDAYLETEFA